MANPTALGGINTPNPTYPEELWFKEREMLAKRREMLHLDPSAPTIAVACSGGGIRSATVCLGVFQAAAEADLLKKIDVISTVSGGGYFGSFLGGLFLPRDNQKPDATDVLKSVRAALV